MEPLTLSEMMRQGIAMPLLLVLSIGVMGAALERLYCFWIAEGTPTALWERVRALLEHGDRQGAFDVCRTSPGTLPQAWARVIALPKTDAASIESAFQLPRQRLSMTLSSRLGVFGTASFIAPLIGLMGTVLGIMRAFRDLAVAGAGGPTVVAAGISEALISTAAGIGVAVASAILYNYFTFSAKRRLGLADLSMLELTELLDAPPAS